MQNFQKSDIPFSILEEFGLSKKMIEDLPDSVMQKLLTGRNTPPLPVTDRTQEGDIARTVSKIALIRKSDGTMDVIFTPRMAMNDLSKFPEQTVENLKAGKVVRTDNGYAQYNDIIEQVAFVPYGFVLHNLENNQESLGLSQQDMNNILKGQPVVITEGEYKGTTIGIDLSADILIRLSKGNAHDWEREQTVNHMQKYNFGINGCWVCDESSLMHYVDHKDYDRYPDVAEAYEAEIRNRQQRQQQASIK